MFHTEDCWASHLVHTDSAKHILLLSSRLLKYKVCSCTEAAQVEACDMSGKQCFQTPGPYQKRADPREREWCDNLEDLEASCFDCLNSRTVEDASCESHPIDCEWIAT